MNLLSRTYLCYFFIIHLNYFNFMLLFINHRDACIHVWVFILLFSNQFKALSVEKIAFSSRFWLCYKWFILSHFHSNSNSKPNSNDYWKWTTALLMLFVILSFILCYFSINSFCSRERVNFLSHSREFSHSLFMNQLSRKIEKYMWKFQIGSWQISWKI